MKGIVLASGYGSRLGILTKEICNKHLLVLYDKPMVFYPLKTLVDSGITDIAIVVGGSHPDKFIPTLKNGKELGIKSLSYIYQDEPLGIAHAIGLCEDFVGQEDVAVILGDNIFSSNFYADVLEFTKGARIFLKDVGFEDAKRFGCPAFNRDGSLQYIEEKPELPRSNYAVTGMYMFDPSVFSRIRKLRPSSRGEMEVTDLNQMYIDDGLMNFSYIHKEAVWIDAGTYDSLLKASVWAAGNAKK